MGLVLVNFVAFPLFIEKGGLLGISVDVSLIRFVISNMFTIPVLFTAAGGGLALIGTFLARRKA